jgi:hypothetical protein
MQVLLIVFAAELLLKVISYGFFIGQGAYLKSHWNKIDFIVVIAGMIDQIAGIFLPNDNPALVRICCHFDVDRPSNFATELHSNYSSAESFQASAPDFAIRGFEDRFTNDRKIDSARPFNCSHIIGCFQYIRHSRRTVVHGEVQDLQR